MLLRAIIDHVPPLFGAASFPQLVGNIGSQSFKQSMRFLDEGLRSIADAHLHTQIRKREALPAMNQVDPFRAPLDVLYAEILTKPWINQTAPTNLKPAQRRHSSRATAETRSHPQRTNFDLSKVRSIHSLWKLKSQRLRSKNGASYQQQKAWAAQFFDDFAAIYGTERRWELERRFPGLANPQNQTTMDAQFRTLAFTDIPEWEASLSPDRISTEHPDLDGYISTRIADLRGEYPGFGIGD